MTKKVFLTDIESAPIHACNVFDDVDDYVWFQNKIVIEVLDEHAPVKKKHVRRKQAPFMNGESCKAKRKSKETNKFGHKNEKKRSLKLYFENKCENIKNGAPKHFGEL